MTTAPALPATTLASSCYRNMFNGCGSLTTAPALPATTLASNCYDSMFRNCTGLTAAPALPATTLDTSCYSAMFYGCKFTTAPTLPATTLAKSCYYQMFTGCYLMTTAPVLPATVLTSSCYDSMFFNCPLINAIECHAVNMSASSCTNIWLISAPASGTFTKHPSATWTTGTSGIPSGWTVVDLPGYNITFDVDQNDATIYVNGVALSGNVYVGITNETISYEVVKPGYELVFGELTISGDQTISITMTPEAPAQYLTIQAKKASSVKFDGYQLWQANAKSIQYSKDGGTTWTTISVYAGANINVPLETGEKMLIRGTLQYTSLGNNYQYMRIYPGSDCLIWGPITSLLDSQYRSTLPDYALCGLFENAGGSFETHPMNPITIESDSLGVQSCYRLFYSCPGIKNIKCLATTLGSNCTQQWLLAGSSTGTFTKATGVTWAAGSDGIPSGWTVVEETPPSNS